MGNERFRGFFLILKRVAQVVSIITVADVIGSSVLLYAQGRLEYFSFAGSLILLFLLEGCIVGAAGGLMYFGLDAIGVVRKEAHNPAVTEEQLKNRKERLESQQRWAVMMIAAGLLMILIGLMISSLAQI